MKEESTANVSNNTVLNTVEVIEKISGMLRIDLKNEETAGVNLTNIIKNILHKKTVLEGKVDRLEKEIILLKSENSYLKGRLDGVALVKEWLN